MEKKNKNGITIGLILVIIGLAMILMGLIMG